MKGVLKFPGSLLLTVLRRLIWCISYFVIIGVGVSCRIFYSVVSYSNVSFSRLITSVGEGRAFICYRLLVIMWFLFGEVSSSSWCLG